MVTSRYRLDDILCPSCKKLFHPKQRGRKFCSSVCYTESCKRAGIVWKKGNGETVIGSYWKGGKKLYVMQHVWVMQKVIGRPITAFERVTHKNGIKNDNRPKNLALASKVTPWESRFSKKLEAIAGGENACWPWRGARMRSSGYGVFNVGAYNKPRQVGAHRLAYQLFIGTIPPNYSICHHCDNPPCCNPKHLFAGTALDNMTDMHAKGRRSYYRAEKCWRGHMYSGENLYIEPKKGARQCLACKSISNRKSYLKRSDSWKKGKFSSPPQNKTG